MLLTSDVLLISPVMICTVLHYHDFHCSLPLSFPFPNISGDNVEEEDEGNRYTTTDNGITINLLRS